MATFSTPKFDAAVTRFKGHFTGHAQLFEFGQFYVTDRTFVDMIAAANTALTPWPLAASTFIPFLTAAEATSVSGVLRPESSSLVAAVKEKPYGLGIAIRRRHVSIGPGTPDSVVR